MPPCDSCDRPAVWLAFAAYDVSYGPGGPVLVHPWVARYPAPMVRACTEHLLGLLTTDSYAEGSTGQWLVRPVPDDGGSL
jgi:hypothetical protein